MRAFAPTQSLKYLSVFLPMITVSFALQYRLHDKPLTDMTVPQVSAQVVSPAVYEQLGGQDKALQEAERRFEDVDRRFKDVDTALTGIKADIKPLQDTNLEVHFIMKLAGWIFGILGGSSLLGVILHYLREHWPGKRRIDSPTRPTSSTTEGVLTSVYGDQGKRDEHEVQASSPAPPKIS